MPRKPLLARNKAQKRKGSVKRSLDPQFNIVEPCVLVRRRQDLEGVLYGATDGEIVGGNLALFDRFLGLVGAVKQLKAKIHLR